MKSKTCCFSGHRPKSLPWGYEERGKKFKKFQKQLKPEIIKAICNGYENFISGMAMGMDMLAAEVVLKLKKKHSNIKLECAIPCTNQTEKWMDSYKNRYEKILSKADKVTMHSDKNYFAGCMQIRNKFMVDNSSLIIALYNGTSGGTKQTLDYAKKQNLNLVIINPNEL